MWHFSPDERKYQLRRYESLARYEVVVGGVPKIKFASPNLPVARHFTDLVPWVVYLTTG